jgi:DNA-binding NarL/FixJ family response regulator
MKAELIPEHGDDPGSSDESLLDDPIRLLIADDDERTTMVLRDSLPAFGFDVIGAARNGAEAGAKVAGLHPEVVLMDLRMPGVDGMEATVLIKAQDPMTQVVILTAFPERETKWTAEFMGAADLLDKSASLEELVETLRAAARVYRTSGAHGP